MAFRVWDVRFTILATREWGDPNGPPKTAEYKRNMAACVIAETIDEATAMVLAKWPDAAICFAALHGGEHVILPESR